MKPAFYSTLYGVLTGMLDLSSLVTGYWMKFGTTSIKGSPFIWSQSHWNGQKLQDVPDRLEGPFTLMPLHLW